MRIFLQDLRFALRILSGSRGFAGVAILTFALGISSATTVFSWIDSLLLHPYPGAARPDELAVLEMSTASAPNGGTSLSWLDYTDFRDHLNFASGIAAQRYCSFSIGESDSARLAWGEVVTARYFDVLGVKPLIGRTFSAGPQADTPGAYPAAVISERLWRSFFDSDPAALGKSLRVNRRPFTVIGVVPDRFRGSAPAMLLDLWVPASMSVELGLAGSGMFEDRGDRDFASAIVRLKPGVSLARAQAELSTVAAGLADAYPKTNRRVSATIVSPWRARSGLGQLLLSPLRILMAISLLLLAIVCANVANLLLARSVARDREFGVRIALGASRWRIARQLMTEMLILAGGGALAALLLLPWMWNSLLILTPDVGLPIAREFDLNFRIAGFLILLCLASALAAGLTPALLSARSNLNEVLKQGGRSGISGGTHRGARGALVAAEVALATVALVSAGLFTRSFDRARHIDRGFDSSHVLFGRFFLSGTTFSPDQQRAFAVRLQALLRQSPRVQAAGYSDFTPLSANAGPYTRVQPEGYMPGPAESLNVNRALIDTGYFPAMSIPLLEGRDFSDSDDARSAPVMIVNQAFARRFFAAASPIGRRVRVYNRWMTIIGLARDSRYFSPAESPLPFFYLPFAQALAGRLQELDVFVRTDGAPEQAIPQLRRAAAAADSAVAFHPVPLAEYTQVALFPHRIAASLMASLGLMCLFLATLGLYSVMSYSVNQRVPEIGIRMAMGAEPGALTGMLLRQGMRLALPGLAIGLAAALAVTRLVSGILVHVTAYDPATFACATVVLLAAALFATWMPARRAIRIDPGIALRRH